MGLRRGSIQAILLLIGIVIGVIGYVVYLPERPVQEISGLAELDNLKLPPGKSFVIYKIAGKNILHVEFDSREQQNRTLNVIQVFVEDAELHGQILSGSALKEFNKEGTLAVGHNYSFFTLKTFFDEARARHVRLPSQTRRLRARLEGLDLFEKEGGIIATAQDVEDRRDVLVHEYNHAEYYSNPQYRKEVKKIWDGLSRRTQNIIRAIFLQYNYNSEDDDLVLREFAAWFRDDAFVQVFPERERPTYIDIQRQLQGIHLE